MIDIFVKEWAKYKGLTLQQLCERCGWKSYNSMIRQLNNPDKLSMQTLIKIASVLDCKVNDLFTLPGDDGIKCPHCGKTIVINLEKA